LREIAAVAIGADTPLEVAQQVQKRAGLTVKTTNAKGEVVDRPRVTSTSFGTRPRR